VHCKREGKGSAVVAIADVSHYVRPGDALDTASREARQFGVFPAPRHSDAAGEALQRPVLAQCQRGSPVHGVRDERRRAGRDRALSLLCRGDALAGAPDLQPGGGCASLQLNRRAGTAPAHLVPHLQDLYALYHVLAKAREKRGAIDFETIETQMLFERSGQDREHRGDAAQRRALV